MKKRKKHKYSHCSAREQVVLYLHARKVAVQDKNKLYKQNKKIYGRIDDNSCTGVVREQPSNPSVFTFIYTQFALF